MNKNSVIAPDKTYQTQDVQSVAERLNGQHVSQEELWHQRAVGQAQALGIPPQDVIGTDVIVKARVTPKPSLSIYPT